MKIGGLHKTSLIDYPGKICAIIFTQGCNFKCPYCHNPELVNPEEFSALIPEEEIFSFLEKRKKYLDAVSITGGEPLIQKDILEFLGKLKKLGFLIKIDTNGSLPEILQEIIEKNLVNYISMDVKGPLEKYDLIIGVKIDTEKIKESIELIKNSNIDYEFKTTVVKKFLDEKDFIKIGQLLKGTKLYFLQKFVPTKTVNKDFLEEKTYSDEEFENIKNIMKEHVLECKIR